MSIDEDLDRLLQGAFDRARPTGHEDVRGLREGAVARAHGIRRRRRVTTGLVSAVATAALVAGVGSVAGDGWLGRGSNSTAVLPASERDWADLATGAPGEAYSFPSEVSSAAAPAGMSSVPHDQVVGGETPGGESQLRLAGSCPQTVSPEGGRKWVAQTRSNYVGADDPGGSRRAAELTLVGFPTGTGAEAFGDFAAGRGPCLIRADLELTTWDGPGEDGALFLPKPWAPGTAQFGLASVRVGDMLVLGSSLAPSAVEAREEAVSIASRAATQLVQLRYPPALGKVLGTSTQEPEQGPPSAPGEASGLVRFFPDESSLPAGFIYQGEALEVTAAAPVMGVQACDPALVDDDSGMDSAPEAEAQASRMAYTGKGLGGDGAVTVTVSEWATGTGPEMFADLQGNTMMCRFDGSYDRLSWAGRDTASTWLSKHGNPAGLVQYLAAQRVGDLIVAAVVDEQGDRKSATATAIRLSDEAVAKLKASDLPAAKGL